MALPPLDIYVRSLVANGYILDASHTDEGYAIVEMHHYEGNFDIVLKYAFVLYEGLTESSVKAIAKHASRRGASPVFVGPQRFETHPCYTWGEFLGRLGGAVTSWVVNDPELESKLNDLGHNRLPPGSQGHPDILFEDLVKGVLQYLFAFGVAQYGKERRFEALPDGVVFPDFNVPILYDCKAYGKGFSISADDIRRFADYTGDFNRRYSLWYRPVETFLVVTGELIDSADSLQERARELRGKANAQLCVVEASELGNIARLFVSQPALRRTANWSYLLAGNTLKVVDVRKDIERVTKDGLMGGH